jgi:hypothetical protein
VIKHATAVARNIGFSFEALRRETAGERARADELKTAEEFPPLLCGIC